MYSGMIQDSFSIILVEYYIEKCENVLKFTFHDFAAHVKDYISARRYCFVKQKWYDTQIFMAREFFRVFLLIFLTGVLYGHEIFHDAKNNVTRTFQIPWTCSLSSQKILETPFKRKFHLKMRFCQNILSNSILSFIFQNPRFLLILLLIYNLTDVSCGHDFLLMQRAGLLTPSRYLEDIRKVHRKFSGGLWKKSFTS